MSIAISLDDYILHLVILESRREPTWIFCPIEGIPILWLLIQSPPQHKEWNKANKLLTCVNDGNQLDLIPSRRKGHKHWSSVSRIPSKRRLRGGTHWSAFNYICGAFQLNPFQEERTFSVPTIGESAEAQLHIWSEECPVIVVMVILVMWKKSKGLETEMEKQTAAEMFSIHRFISNIFIYQGD